jgi:hypothetical protein
MSVTEDVPKSSAPARSKRLAERHHNGSHTVHVADHTLQESLITIVIV